MFTLKFCKANIATTKEKNTKQHALSYAENNTAAELASPQRKGIF